MKSRNLRWNRFSIQKYRRVASRRAPPDTPQTRSSVPCGRHSFRRDIASLPAYRRCHHHVESQRSPTITPPMRTGITTQFARQPTAENVVSNQLPSTIFPSNLNLEPFLKKVPGALNLLLWAQRRRPSNVWPPRLKSLNAGDSGTTIG